MWVLVAIGLSVYAGNLVSFQEFSDRTSCEAAMEFIGKHALVQCFTKAQGQSSSTLVCVDKGEVVKSVNGVCPPTPKTPY